MIYERRAPNGKTETATHLIHYAFEAEKYGGKPGETVRLPEVFPVYPSDRMGVLGSRENLKCMGAEILGVEALKTD